MAAERPSEPPDAEGPPAPERRRAGASPRRDAPRRGPGAGRGGRRERRRGRGGIVAFLLASAIPLGGVVWLLLMPEEDRSALLDRIPPGVGGRAVAAAASFGLLVLLARVALPAFHGASGGVLALRGALASRPPALRVLLFPLELLLGLVWFLLQLLFAIDAFLIVACALIGLLLVARIAMPGLLPDILPRFAG